MGIVFWSQLSIYILIRIKGQDSKLTASVQVSHFLTWVHAQKYGRRFSNLSARCTHRLSRKLSLAPGPESENPAQAGCFCILCLYSTKLAPISKTKWGMTSHAGRAWWSETEAYARRNPHALPKYLEGRRNYWLQLKLFILALVRGPTYPVGLIELAVWKLFTALKVKSPKKPLGSELRNPLVCKKSCSTDTSPFV